MFFDVGAAHYGPAYWRPASLLLGLGQPSLSLLSLGLLAHGAAVPQIVTGAIVPQSPLYNAGVIGGSATMVGTESCVAPYGGMWRSEYRGQLVLTLTLDQPTAVG